MISNELKVDWRIRFRGSLSQAMQLGCKGEPLSHDVRTRNSPIKDAWSHSKDGAGRGDCGAAVQHFESVPGVRHQSHRLPVEACIAVSDMRPDQIRWGTHRCACMATPKSRCRRPCASTPQAQRAWVTCPRRRTRRTHACGTCPSMERSIQGSLKGPGSCKSLRA